MNITDSEIRKLARKAKRLQKKQHWDNIAQSDSIFLYAGRRPAESSTDECV